MEDLAPSDTEATVVTVLTGVGVLLALALLATLAVLRRRRGPVAPPPGRPALGLAFLTVIATVLLFFGARIPFVDAHPGDSATLFELHGRQAPVYWIAYLIGGGLLVVLVTALLKSPATLRRVVGPPAALVAALMILLMAALRLKISHLDERLAGAHLPELGPTPDASDGAAGAYAMGGWIMGVLGVALLAMVLVLLLARPHDLVVLVAVTAGVTMLSAPHLGADFWGLRDGRAERVSYSAFELGGRALAWPAVITLLAALVVAIPFLPKWFRGVATFAAAVAPLWIGLAVGVSADLLDGVAQRLDAEGYTVAVSRGGSAGMFLYVVTPALVVPIVALRAWSVSRRTAPTAAGPVAPAAAPVELAG
ncbi:hypothetical protein [Dactylosporangium sp. NPDC050588]|uniref:hypothetical protein n=1 Tax=Dactylosporangium sp. NPDC050588 TaxID=3157211 RepID=UPI0033C64B7F